MMRSGCRRGCRPGWRGVHQARRPPAQREADLVSISNYLSSSTQTSSRHQHSERRAVLSCRPAGCATGAGPGIHMRGRGAGCGARAARRGGGAAHEAELRGLAKAPRTDPQGNKGGAP